MADRKMGGILRAISFFCPIFFRPLFFRPFSFLNLRTAQSFNSTSGKSQSHKRTSLQQTLRLRERGEQENKAVNRVTSLARILNI
jgi:hypothetical protein